jgi:hypothetical protein
MVSILSFDSRSLTSLLDEKNSELFDPTYPLFYRNKIQKGPYQQDKYFYRNAVDIAVKFDQARAIERIIYYIIRYQNNVMSSFLFKKNLNAIIQRGIPVTELLDSDVFRMDFDFDEWPSTHTDDSKYIRPYNGSIFDLR